MSSQMFHGLAILFGSIHTCSYALKLFIGFEAFFRGCGTGHAGGDICHIESLDRLLSVAMQLLEIIRMSGLFACTTECRTFPPGVLPCTSYAPSPMCAPTCQAVNVRSL